MTVIQQKNCQVRINTDLLQTFFKLVHQKNFCVQKERKSRVIRLLHASHKKRWQKKEMNEKKANR